MRRALGIRARLTFLVLGALTAALAAATFGFNVLFAHTATSDAHSLLRQRVTGQLSDLHLEKGRLVISSAGDVDDAADARIWVFAGAEPLAAPHTQPATARAAFALAHGPSRYVNVDSTDELLYSRPVLDLSGKRVGTVVAAISVAPYEQTRRAALLGSLAFAAILLAASGGAAWWLLRSGLRVVEKMTEQAAAWSEADLDHRFDFGEPRDEITHLAATLDGLLDRIAASLRRERHFSAEISHELRTPLSKVITEAELALRRERTSDEYRAALETVLRNARNVGRIVETLVAAAQQDAEGVRGTADAYAVLRHVLEATGTEAAGRQLAVDAAEPGQQLRVGVDANLAERILQPIVENACRYARTHVRVELARRGSRVVYVVTDDGPGVGADERDVIFEPGRRGRAARDVAGAGLGLALARRLARASSGEVSADVADGGRFKVELPAA